jgi:dTDP-glucose pyrophosphorylase
MSSFTPDNEPTVLLTAAGDMDAAFTISGFSAPKNLVEIDGKPLLQHALEGYASFKNVSVAIRATEFKNFETASVLRSWNPNIKVVPTNPMNKGALVTALCALQDANPNAPLIIAAGDSALRCDMSNLFNRFLYSGHSAAAVTFQSFGSRWSYVALDLNGEVEEVQEKREISNLATTGTFFFRQASDFIGAAEWCLVNKAMTNGQFFTSAALNFIVSRGLKVTHLEIPTSEYESYSTPEDVMEALHAKK